MADQSRETGNNLEVRPEHSNFPWWNHWPVAQIISDVRSASAPDRASHSSLSWGDPGKDYDLYGITNDHNAVHKLARSRNRPATLEVNKGFTYKGIINTLWNMISMESHGHYLAEI